MVKNIAYTLFFCFLAMACSQDDKVFVPKQRGYPRVVLPEPAYQNTPDSLPYSFEYSKHAKLLNDTSVVAKKHWFEMYYPYFQANIDISYYPINAKKEKFDDFINDSHTLALKHKIKAYAIDEVSFKTQKGYSAIIFELQGDVPSQLQFYVTDSTKNFLRASLYFPTATQNDSLAPMIQYIKKDMMHILHSVDWKNK
jgi:gliding motility-associated lipoprotein GldD